MRVVQNRRFFLPRTYLEKDVAPSVLSSGGALSIELSFSDKSLSGAQSIGIDMLHQRTIGRSITTYGSLRATPKNPMGKGEILLSPCIPINQKGEVSSPFMDFPSIKGACHSPSWTPSTNPTRIGCCKRFDAEHHGRCECRYCRSKYLLTSTTVSPVEDDQGATLDAYVYNCASFNIFGC